MPAFLAGFSSQRRVNLREKLLQIVQTDPVHWRNAREDVLQIIPPAYGFTKNKLDNEDESKDVFVGTRFVRASL